MKGGNKQADYVTKPVDEDIHDNYDSCISESPPCSQVPSIVVSEDMSAWPLAVNQAIVKGVFDVF